MSDSRGTTSEKPSLKEPGKSRSTKTVKSVWFFRLLVLFVAFVVAEAGLNILCAVSQDVRLAMSPPSSWLQLSAVVHDSQLRFRGDPRIPEHDALGFRNPALPAQSDVVVIGDSQTYGTSVEWYQAYPVQLSRMSSLNVYNMGMSGWGPVHYRALLGDALKFKPQLVIAGLYFGNDIFDSYRDVSELKIGADLRDAEQWKDKLEHANQSNKAIEQIGELYSQTLEDYGRPASRPIALPSDDESGLLRHCKLARLVSSTWRVVSGIDRRTAEQQWEGIKSWSVQRENHLMVIESEDVRTVLTVPYRGFAVNHRDARIQEGLKITEEVLEQMADRCRKADTKFLVLLIPTKESVFQPLARKGDIESVKFQVIPAAREVVFDCIVPEEQCNMRQ
jgi:hypothetical protein